MSGREEKLIRIVVCIDVPAETAGDAYRQLRAALDPLGIGFETTDEWYNNQGMLIDEMTIGHAMRAFFEEEDRG